ncbi:hypothetical protein D9758_011597 [Tetrapyrgos nigripes]|uniref:Origin recognition complex subunit 6 n=1 Tax=Tetrapyrgos nigripes TaxID=182062 RepID=A0A8H5CPZ1_9AGAR|nr:hypothetical protein D9758_011597 [Tetrapyrgos nigripes]
MSQRQDTKAIESVASDKKTIQKAHDLLQQARPKTGPGSGFDLSKMSNAMAIACAVIASEMLRTNDVDPSQAQKVACLSQKDFQHCCATIKRVLQLDGDASPRRGKSGSSLWRTLVALNPISIEWSRFEGFLMQCKNGLRIILAEKNIRYPEADVDCGTFFWVYEIVEVNQPLDINAVADEGSASAKSLSKICKHLDDRCQKLRSTIANDVAKSKAKFALPNPAAPARVSPTKRAAPRRELPTRDSKRTKLSDDAGALAQSPTKDVEMQSSGSGRVTRSALSPSKPSLPASTPSPMKSSVKRTRVEVTVASVEKHRSTLLETSSDVEMTPPETPSKPKRTVTTSPSKAAPAASSSTPTLDKLRGRPDPSPTRTSRPSTSARPPSPSPSIRQSPRKSQAAAIPETAAASTPVPPAAPSSTSPKKAPRIVRAVAGSHRMQVDNENENDDSSSSSEDEDPPEPVRQRFRPVFHDRKQWERRDPRVDIICKQAEILKKKRIEKFGHPFDGKYRPSIEAL